MTPLLMPKGRVAAELDYPVLDVCSLASLGAENIIAVTARLQRIQIMLISYSRCQYGRLVEWKNVKR